MSKDEITTYANGKGVVTLRVAPNQKVVEIHKVHPKKGKILDIHTNKCAMSNLSPPAYMLYMYFVLNVPGYKIALSLNLILEHTSLSERMYYKSVKELIDKQYLVKTPNNNFSEYYLFCESSETNYLSN